MRCWQLARRRVSGCSCEPFRKASIVQDSVVRRGTCGMNQDLSTNVGHVKRQAWLMGAAVALQNVHQPGFLLSCICSSHGVVPNRIASNRQFQYRHSRPWHRIAALYVTQVGAANFGGDSEEYPFQHGVMLKRSMRQNQASLVLFRPAKSNLPQDVTGVDGGKLHVNELGAQRAKPVTELPPPRLETLLKARTSLHAGCWDPTNVFTDSCSRSCIFMTNEVVNDRYIESFGRHSSHQMAFRCRPRGGLPDGCSQGDVMENRRIG